MKIALKDRWDHIDGRYVELKLGKYEACCVKENPDGSIHVMEFDDEKNVYSDIGGADFPLRKLTDKEMKEVMEFVDEQFEVERMLSGKEK